MSETLAGNTWLRLDRTITRNRETAAMQDEIWDQFGIQNYNGYVISVDSGTGRMLQVPLQL